MNDETIPAPTENEAAPAAPLSEAHAGAPDAATSQQASEDTSAAGAPVQEAAADNAHPAANEVEKAAALYEAQLPGVDVSGEALTSAHAAEGKPEPELHKGQAHSILTTIEDEIESLLHSPLALVAWVKGKVAEAKAKL